MFDIVDGPSPEWQNEGSGDFTWQTVNFATFSPVSAQNSPPPTYSPNVHSPYNTTSPNYYNTASPPYNIVSPHYSPSYPGSPQYSPSYNGSPQYSPSYPDSQQHTPNVAQQGSSPALSSCTPIALTQNDPAIPSCPAAIPSCSPASPPHIVHSSGPPAPAPTSPPYAPNSPSNCHSSPVYAPTSPSYRPVSPSICPDCPHDGAMSQTCDSTHGEHSSQSASSIADKQVVQSAALAVSSETIPESQESILPWSQTSSSPSSQNEQLNRSPPTPADTEICIRDISNSPIYDPAVTNYTPSSPFLVEATSTGLQGTAADQKLHICSPNNSCCSPKRGTPLLTYPSPSGTTAFLAHIIADNTSSNCPSTASTPKSMASSQNSLSPLFPQTPRLYDSPDMFGVERLPSSEVISHSHLSNSSGSEDVPNVRSRLEVAEVVVHNDETTRTSWTGGQGGEDSSSSSAWLSGPEYGPTPLACGMGYTEATQYDSSQ